MRASRILFNAGKKGGFNIPLELTPLFVAMGVAVTSACFFSYRKFAYDKSLRLTRNPRQQSDDLDKYLTAKAEGAKETAQITEVKKDEPSEIKTEVKKSEE